MSELDKKIIEYSNKDKFSSDIRKKLRDFFVGAKAVEELTADRYEQILSDKSKRNFGVAAAFVAWLDREGLISDPLVKRIGRHAALFTSQTPPETGIAVMRSPEYNRYDAEGLFNTHDGTMVFLYGWLGIKDICHVNTPLLRAVEKAVYDTAHDESTDMDRRYDKIKRLRLFAQYAPVFIPEPITAESILSYLKSIKKPAKETGLPKNVRTLNISHLVEILNNAADSGDITDGRLLYFLRELFPQIKDREDDSSRSLDEYIEILDADDIYRYAVISNDRYQRKSLFYINVPPESAIRNEMLDFLRETSHMALGDKVLCRYFEQSFDRKVPSTAADLTLEDYLKQINYYCRLESTDGTKNLCAALNNFYMYVWNRINPDLFVESRISPRILARKDITQLITTGFEIIPYSRLDPVPEADKWLLSFAGQENSTSAVRMNGTQIFDFSDLGCHEYKTAARSYIWKDTNDIATRAVRFSHVKRFLLFMYSLRTGGRVTFSPDGEVHLYNQLKFGTIDGQALVAFRNDCTGNKDISPFHVFAAVRSFLNFTSDEGLFEVDETMPDILKAPTPEYNTAHPIPDDEMQRIMEYFAEAGKTSLRNRLVFHALSLTQLTDIRITEIFALEVDSMREKVLKEGVYDLYLKRKMSDGSYDVYHPVPEVKHIYDDILENTRELRESSSDDELRKYLFIVPSVRKGNFASPFTYDMFFSIFRKTCDRLGLPRYNAGNLRDTHMNKADIHAIEHNFINAERFVLTHHKSVNTDRKHYLDDTWFLRALEITDSLVIGVVNENQYPMKGSVVKYLSPDIAKKTNLVQKDTGYCGKKTCVSPMRSCLLCNFFSTDISHKIDFQVAAKETEAAILSAETEHEADDLRLELTLYTMYLDRIIQMEKETGKGEGK